MTFHAYDDRDQNGLSWWDNFTFIINDYRVSVARIHPRMVYQDRIQDEAFQQTEHLRGGEIFTNGTLNFKKLGRSRKKILLWTRDAPTGRTWFDAVDAAEQRIAKIADYQIAPFLKARWFQYARFVELCVPVEVHNVDDLQKLAVLTKRILDRELSLNDVFPGYRYTREDWVRDGLADRNLIKGVGHEVSPALFHASV